MEAVSRGAEDRIGPRVGGSEGSFGLLLCRFEGREMVSNIVGDEAFEGLTFIIMGPAGSKEIHVRQLTCFIGSLS